MGDVYTMTNEEENLLHTIAFSMLEGVSEKQKLIMLRHYGSATNIYHLYKKNNSLWPSHAAEDEINFITKHNIDCFAYLDNDYPNRLNNISDPPLALYTKGSTQFNLPQLISIVGTRQHTYQVNKVIQELLEGLQHLKMGVISGMALGIDGIAHALSLNNKIPTWGILAHGLDTIYPNAHRRLAINMLSNGGLITECRQKTITMPYQFPKRNRIVAGMSDATIVIESAVEGGSMITAKLARGYDREVFAVPGKIHDAKSKGCLWLIKNNIATLYHDPIHLLENMNWPAQNKIAQDEALPIMSDDLKIQSLLLTLPPILQSIYLLIQLQGPIHNDAIAQQLAIASAELSNHLLSLELINLIHLQAGNLYSVT
jgi:DNA processing protein